MYLRGSKEQGVIQSTPAMEGEQTLERKSCSNTFGQVFLSMGDVDT